MSIIRYRRQKHYVFGPKYSGNVERPVLKFLYDRRDTGKRYYIHTISDAIGVDEENVRGALTRLHDRRFVLKSTSRRDARYSVWRLRPDAHIHRRVERLIGIRLKSTESDYDEHTLDKISHAAEKISPLIHVLETLSPPTAAPIAVGHLIISNLGTFGNLYTLTTTDTSSYEFKRAWDRTVDDVTKRTYGYVTESLKQPMKNIAVSNIVEKSSDYLKENGVFSGISKALKIDDAYDSVFEEFYETSMSEYLREKI